MSDFSNRHNQQDPSAQRPPNQLDDLIAEHRAAEAKRRRRDIPAAVALILFGVAGVVFGPGLPVATFVAAWIAGAGVFFLVGRNIRNRHERGHGPRGRLVTGKVGGEPAMVLHQHIGREGVAAAFVAYLGLFFAVGGWFAVADARTTSVLVVLVIVLLPFVLVASRRIIRAHGSGVWLTTSALLVRNGGTSYSTGWDDVAGVSKSESPTDLVVVLPRTMASLTVTGRDRGARPGVVLGDIPITTEALAVDAYALVDLIWHYQQPQNRPELGTPAALATVRWVQASPR
jgi:hypothetical protein